VQASMATAGVVYRVRFEVRSPRSNCRSASFCILL